ncbi:glycoside hydrolase family 88/105 protein [Paraglaciecola hydrolytica]|nr:glycoside hydrolase family 88 protein [Paraglaciecola hydrolytica]
MRAKQKLMLCGLGLMLSNGCSTQVQDTNVTVGSVQAISQALNLEHKLVPYQAPTTSELVLSSEFNLPAITQVANHVADWQLAQFDIRSNQMRTEMRPSGLPSGWMYATLMVGLWHWAESSDSAAFRQATLNLAQLNDYQLGPRATHADDQAIGDVYISLYEKFGNERRIQATQTMLTQQIQTPSQHSLEFTDTDKDTHEFALRTFVDPNCTVRWCWADAVFMAPPVFAHLAKTTGDPAYLDYMDKEFWQMTDYLFDKNYQLYLRDSRYFERKDEAGLPIFWGRGNGWILAGLARTINYLPDSFANKPQYTELFSSISAALLKYQKTDGSWPSSLLENSDEQHPETSATALIAYGLAWGINHGLLERDKYLAPLTRAWQSIVANVHPDGKVGYVQQVAFAPGSATYDDTQLYGSGALLLAAAEIKLLLASEQ